MGGYLDGKQQPINMADAHDVVERSFNINSKLGPRLIAAAEQNAILRIGWTNAGEPVPKNGELGLCPNLPKGARMRALGRPRVMDRTVWERWYFHVTRAMLVRF
jgi:hypothetical protein